MIIHITTQEKAQLTQVNPILTADVLCSRQSDGSQF